VLTEQIRGSTAREIAASAETAIREGALATGAALPTVRALAHALGTSPATVSSAYRILGQRGLVIARGRRGTRVAPRPAVRLPLRPPGQARGSSAGAAGLDRHDLTHGLSDPALLPDVGAAVARLKLNSKLGLSGLDGPDPELLKVAAASFDADGIPADAVTVVAGALDGIERVLEAHLRPGDTVAIEDPAYPPFRDILLALGVETVPVPVDDRGMLPAALGTALDGGVDGILTIPRAQNPLGSALDDERAGELRAVLERRPDVLIVEDDHAGAVGGAPFVSLITPDRPRWSVIRSVSKTLHPDLRLALAAGDETTIARVEGRQALGPRWVSHILQATAAELLRDPSYGSSAARARERYSIRRRALIGELSDRGVRAHGRSGLNVWVPVREEALTVRALADAGWLVLAGERFRITAAPAVRITISTLEPGDAAEVAQIVAAVERAGRPRRAY
jgi:DNA-binding transcriptional MocR family regulator